MICILKAMVFPIVMYGWDSWTIKKPENRRINVLELWCWRRLLRVPWTARWLNQQIFKEINSEYPSSVLNIGRTDAVAEAPILWPLEVISCLIGKDPDAGKHWEQEKRAAEDEMVGWHHWLNGHELGWTLWDGKGQGSLVCYGPWGCKELDTS